MAGRKTSSKKVDVPVRFEGTISLTPRQINSILKGQNVSTSGKGKTKSKTKSKRRRGRPKKVSSYDISFDIE